MSGHSKPEETEWVDARDDRVDRTGTRFSIFLVGVMTVGVGWLLATYIQAIEFVGLGVGGIGLFAVSFWLYGFERWRVPARLLSNLVAPVSAVAILGAVGLLTAREFAARFPAPTVSQIPAPALELLSHVLVLVAVLFAALGVIATLRPVLTNQIFIVAFAEQLKMLLFLGIVSGIAEFLYLRTNPPMQVSAEIQQLLEWQPGEILGGLFLVPDAEPNLFPVLLLSVLALWSVNLAYRTLPLPEVRRHLGVQTERDLAVPLPIREFVYFTAALTMMVGILGLAISFGLSSDLAAFNETYPGVVEYLRPIAASASLRVLLAGLILMSLGVYGAMWIVKKLARADAAGMLGRFTPLVPVGFFVTIVLLLQPTPELFGLVDVLVSNAPAGTPADMRPLITEVIRLVGPIPLTLLGITSLVGLALFLTTTIGMLLGVEYLPETQAGASLASAGLFLGVAFATTIGFPLDLTLAGLVGSMVVWDAGEFGQTLGAEVGRSGYASRIELVHVGGTLVVGLVAGMIALWLQSMVQGFTVTNLSIIPVVLISGIAGILLLVIALR